eukprot:tig00020553_g10763.t1
MASFVAATGLRTFSGSQKVGFFAASPICPAAPQQEAAFEIRADTSGSAIKRITNPSSSPIAGDNRMFKITFCLPQTSQRLEAGRKLFNVYNTKLVPFSNWYREQQRIQKAGGRIFKVELVSGKKNVSVGLQ